MKTSHSPRPVTAATAAAPTVRVRETACHFWCDEPFTEQVANIFKRVKAHLNRRGFALCADKAVTQFPSLKHLHRHGKRGDLEVVVQLAGRHVEVEFFQNVHNVQNSNGGRYDFDKLKRMPYLLRQRTRLELRKLSDLGVTLGASLVPADMDRPSPQGVTALQFIQNRIETCWHYQANLGHADWHCDSNRMTQDRQLLTHGAAVYFTDSKGRWSKGTAYYNLNNMWWVATGPHTVTNLASFQLRLTAPLDLRAKDNLGSSQKRVEVLLQQAVAAEDFLRAAKLKQIRTHLAEKAERYAEKIAADLVQNLRTGPSA